MYDLADEVRATDVDATGLIRVYVGIGLQIAATIIDEMAAEILCEDMVGGDG